MRRGGFPVTSRLFYSGLRTCRICIAVGAVVAVWILNAIGELYGYISATIHKIWQDGKAEIKNTLDRKLACSLSVCVYLCPGYL